MFIKRLIFPSLILLFGGCSLFKSTGEPTSYQPSQQLATQSGSIQSEDNEVPTADEAEIAQAIIDQAQGISAGELTVNIAYNDGSFATGTLNHTYPESVANKIWIISQTEGDWQLVHYGSPAVDCSLVEAHDVPAELVQVCVASPSGELIQRLQP